MSTLWGVPLSLMVGRGANELAVDDGGADRILADSASWAGLMGVRAALEVPNGPEVELSEGRPQSFLLKKATSGKAARRCCRARRVEIGQLEKKQVKGVAGETRQSNLASAETHQRARLEVVRHVLLRPHALLDLPHALFLELLETEQHLAVERNHLAVDALEALLLLVRIRQRAGREDRRGDGVGRGSVGEVGLDDELEDARDVSDRAHLIGPELRVERADGELGRDSRVERCETWGLGEGGT